MCERAYVHVDWAKRDYFEHKVGGWCAAHQLSMPKVGRILQRGCSAVPTFAIKRRSC